MKNYLGEETITDLSGTPFDGFWPEQWVMLYLERYGQTDGSHHKAWVLDQVARILKGAPVEVRLAKWEGGLSEYRFHVGTCPAYERWVEQVKQGGEYDYDEGIAP